MDSCDASNKEAHNDSANRSRVLILGSGFGGIYAALELEKLLRRRDDVTVTLVPGTRRGWQPTRTARWR